MTSTPPSSDIHASNVTLQSHSSRLSDLAARQPDAVAIHEVPADPATPHRAVTFAELDRDVTRMAHLLQAQGVGPGVLVAVSLPDTVLHATAVYGAWRLGACVLPISPKLPEEERRRLLGVTGEFRRSITVGQFVDGGKPDVPLSRESLAEWPTDPFPDCVAEPAIAIGSGGTSGTPKVTIDGSPGLVPIQDGELVLPTLLQAMGAKLGQVRLVCTPLYHTNGFGLLTTAIVMGDTVVLVERFDADRVLAAIERYRINQMVVVPTVLQRLAQAATFAEADLSSLEAVGFGGSHCPDWVPRLWIERIGATHVYAGYGATEAVGKAVLRGDEWLAHPGSCGRPTGTELRVLGEDGQPVPTGEVGELYMRPIGASAPQFRYLGADYRGVTEDGFVSLGDYGWLDEDGYLYIADRRTDLIITGGANVYPAEVESAIGEHPGVVDAAVVGLPDDEWGHRVHAIVEIKGVVSAAELTSWCRERLAPYKCPKTIEFVDTLPRTEVGKISRARLVEERVAASAKG